MMYPHLFSLGIASFLAMSVPGLCIGQGIDNSEVGNVHVHVVYPDDHGAGMHLRVQLMNGSGNTPISEDFTNDRGVAEFIRVPTGSYHVAVSGEGIQDADSGEFEIDRRKTSQDVFITVRSNSSNKSTGTGGGASVAAADLAIPIDARKKFDRAVKTMGEQNWPKALEQLNSAIAIYPQYAAAYTNIGVVYGRMNDSAREHEALEKAIRVNDHFVPAYLNLAKLCVKERDAAKAETLLESANRIEPANAEILTLLAEAQLLNKHYDAAVTSAHSAHALPHQNFAVIHYIAARALEHENRSLDALAELKIFLSEEPEGARADHVREEVIELEKRVRP
jgi:cytochrome c-type biogenesis protein CcmH/NrfG